MRIGDLEVGRIGLGAMRLTGPGIWGEPRDPEAARAVLRRAVELGVGLIDTADSYGPEASERLIAETLHPYPDGLVIATKGGHTRPGPRVWATDCRPESLRAACEGSLRRLRLERIDLYQLHTVDPAVPWEEQVGALADLRAEGKIRHVGLCNVDVEHVEAARRIVPIVSVQNRYSLVERSSEPVLRHCEAEGLAFLCWLPLEQGALTRRSSRVGAANALAWILARSPATLPIPGTCSVAHLEENMAGLAAAAPRLDEYRLRGLPAAERGARKLARRALAAGRRG